MIDGTGRVIAVIGPSGVGYETGCRWGYGGHLPSQAVAISRAMEDVTYVTKYHAWFKPGKAYMGVETSWMPREEARSLDVHAGALVTGVYIGSPAEEAGIRASIGSEDPNGTLIWWLGGDIIVSVDGIRLTKAGQMEAIVTRHKAGDAIAVRLWREGKLITSRVSLARCSK